MAKKRSPEMLRFHQRLMVKYTKETEGRNGVKHTRKPLFREISQEEFQRSLDEARQLSIDITARHKGARAAGTKFYCLACENGYDQPAGRGYHQTCPLCQAEHHYP